MKGMYNIMKEKDAKIRISNIEECQKALKRLSDNEKEPYFKDVFKCSNNMLDEYKSMLLEIICKDKLVNVWHTKLYERYFPFTEDSIVKISDADKDSIIRLARRTEREIRSESWELACNNIGFFPSSGLFFSASRLVDILQGYETEIKPIDIDILNMILYRNQYVAPISCFVKPLLPRRYCLSQRLENIPMQS